MPCHVSTHVTKGCAARVSAFTLNVRDTFFHFQSAFLIVILQHTEYFLPSEGTHLCVKWCLVCSNKHIILRNHLTLIFRFCTSASPLLSNPNVNEASGRPTWNPELNWKHDLFFFLFQILLVVFLQWKAWKPWSGTGLETYSKAKQKGKSFL